MVRLLQVSIGVILGAALTAGCAHKLALAPPTAAPTGSEAPVGLRNLQVTTIEGHRAVLLRLSRVPTMVRQSSANDPARIIIQAWGPASDDLPERSLPQMDPQINDVRVSRRQGALQVVVDFKGKEPPPFSVHEMADWIMVRFGGTEG